MKESYSRIFQKLVKLRKTDIRFGQPEDVGEGTYQVTAEAVSIQSYQQYIGLLTECGFIKHSDNGQSGQIGYVYTSSFILEDYVLTVIYLVRPQKLYLSLTQGRALSDRLFYDPDAAGYHISEAKTKLHMLEMFGSGNSFLIQLKNGHFIMNDGGLPEDLPYFLDYLEALTFPGEKPIIEGWFFSHAHSDHVGLLHGFLLDPKQAERLTVEGIYMNIPNTHITSTLQAEREMQWIRDGLPLLKVSDESAAPVYRMQTGQRYYFQDITVDIVHTQEQLPFAEYVNQCRPDGFNDSSAWLMYTIEGQRFLLAGDADIGSMRKVTGTYGRDFFNLTLYATFHHGINVEDFFTDYCNIKTVLYTTWWGRRDLPSCSEKYREKENRHLQETAEEFMCWGDGTKVLTFPYTSGSAQTLPPQTWSYHPQRSK